LPYPRGRVVPLWCDGQLLQNFYSPLSLPLYKCAANLGKIIETRNFLEDYFKK
jgi:hypothetical protein